MPYVLADGQKKTSVSLVRVEPPSQNGHSPNESTNDDNQEEPVQVNLTIEGFYSPQVTNSNTMTTSNPIDSHALEGALTILLTSHHTSSLLVY